MYRISLALVVSFLMLAPDAFGQCGGRRGGFFTSRASSSCGGGVVTSYNSGCGGSASYNRTYNNGCGVVTSNNCGGCVEGTTTYYNRDEDTTAAPLKAKQDNPTPIVDPKFPKLPPAPKHPTEMEAGEVGYNTDATEFGSCYLIIENIPATATVTINSLVTSQQGVWRAYRSDKLKPGHSYSYEIVIHVGDEIRSRQAVLTLGESKIIDGGSKTIISSTPNITRYLGQR